MAAGGTYCCFAADFGDREGWCDTIGDRGLQTPQQPTSTNAYTQYIGLPQRHRAEPPREAAVGPLRRFPMAGPCLRFPRAAIASGSSSTSGGQLAARFGWRPQKTGVAAAALHVHGTAHERSDSFDSRPEAVRERERGSSSTY